ncbi:MAG: ATP-binding protein [Ruminococcaceae bacterium]|nr:ATP-binding protein [Oscillospiraceae bacterium]
MLAEIALYILDIARNSLDAGSTRVEISLTVTDNARVSFRIIDNGCGMDEDTLAHALVPGFSLSGISGRGYGLPTLKKAALDAFGSFSLRSFPGHGTCVEVSFCMDCALSPVLGDVEETVRLLVITNPGVDFLYTRNQNGRTASMDTASFREILGELYKPMQPEILTYIQDYLCQMRLSLLS